jgi:hypothetical protein
LPVFTETLRLTGDRRKREAEDRILAVAISIRQKEDQMTNKATARPYSHTPNNAQWRTNGAVKAELFRCGGKDNAAYAQGVQSWKRIIKSYGTRWVLSGEYAPNPYRFGTWDHEFYRLGQEWSKSEDWHIAVESAEMNDYYR